MKVSSLAERLLSLALYVAAITATPPTAHANGLVDNAASSVINGDITMIGGSDTAGELNVGSVKTLSNTGTSSSSTSATVEGNIVIDARTSDVKVDIGSIER